jgi:hypothetical protein
MRPPSTRATVPAGREPARGRDDEPARAPMPWRGQIGMPQSGQAPSPEGRRSVRQLGHSRGLDGSRRSGTGRGMAGGAGDARGRRRERLTSRSVTGRVPFASRAAAPSSPYSTSSDPCRPTRPIAGPNRSAEQPHRPKHRSTATPLRRAQRPRAKSPHTSCIVGIRSYSRLVMTLHKLTAGDGYAYLTRQVAAHDSTDLGPRSLSEYYLQ